MGYALKKTEFTPEDYLVWEAKQTVKCEYVRGEVFADLDDEVAQTAAS